MNRYLLIFIMLLNIPGNAQNINKNLVTFISEMNEKHTVMKLIKEGVKEKEEQRVKYNKEIGVKDAEIKGVQDELNKIKLSYNAKLIEVKTKDVEQTSKEADVNKTIAQLAEIEKKIKGKSGETTKKADEIVSKNNQINVKTNDVLDKTEIAEKKVKEVNAKQAEVNQKTNIIENLTKEISAKTNEIVKKSSDSDSVLVFLKKEMEELSIKKDSAQNEQFRSREELDKLKKEEAKLRVELQGTKDELSRLKEEKEALNNWVNKANGEIEIWDKETMGLKGKLNNQKSEAERIRGDKMSLKDQAETIKLKLLTAESKLKNIQEAKEKIVIQSDILKKEIEKTKSESFELTFQGVDNAKKSLFDKAIESYTLALVKDVKNWDAYFLRGYIFYISGNIKASAIDINKSLEINPENAQAFLVKADIDVADGNYYAATKDYDKVISLEPKNKHAYFGKANINYYFLNETSKACNDWDTAEELGHDEAKAALDSNCRSGKQRTVFAMVQITEEATDTTYGYNALNPIKVGKGDNPEDSHRNQTAYLELLRGQSGEMIKYQRLGTCCQYKSNNGINGIAMLDKFQVYYVTKRGTTISKLMYISSYDYGKPMVPTGFKTTHKIE